MYRDMPDAIAPNSPSLIQSLIQSFWDIQMLWIPREFETLDFTLQALTSSDPQKSQDMHPGSLHSDLKL